MAQDWDFKAGEMVCELRAAGVLVRDGKILLVHNLINNEYWLPGGHVEVGELSKQAVAREFHEEFDADVTVKNLLYVSEFFSHWQGSKTHVVQFEYELSASQLKLDFVGAEPDSENLWLRLDELSGLKVMPEDLLERMSVLIENVEEE